RNSSWWMAASRSASCISTTSCAPGSRKPRSSPASSRSKSPNRRLYPALELPQRHLPDHQHAGRAVVEARYCREILAPALFEDTLPLDCDLLQRFEAIGRKTRRDHREILPPALGKLLEGEIGRGLEPFAAAEPGLKRHRQFRRLEIEPLAQKADGFDAMGIVGIAVVDIGLRHAVERGEDDVRLKSELGELCAGRGSQRLDI